MEYYRFFILALFFSKHKEASLRIDRRLSFSYIRKMIGGLFRFLLYVVVAYMVYAFLRFLFFPRRSSRPGRSRPQLSGIMVKDEVCNTYLSKDEAILEKIDGEDHYFCSQECRQKFLEERKSQI
jgi:YHS domain-containing protein